MSTPYVARSEGSAFGDLSTSGVSWSAVFAGAAAAAALSYILVILGFGLGLSSVSPWTNTGAAATTIGVATILWLTFTQIIASGMGGYLAGRLRVKWSGVHTDEIYFRDTAHGFLAWAVASLAVAAFLASSIAAVVSGGASVAGAAMSGAGQAVSAASAHMDDSKTDPTGYFVDTLFRSDAGANPATSTPADAEASATMGASTGNVSGERSSQTRAEVGRIFARSLLNGSLSAQDRQYLVSVVARRAGVSQAEAEQRIDSAYASMKQSADEAKAKAKEAADTARKATAGLSLWMFISLLCGAFAASLSATFGGRRRDHVVETVNPPIR